MKTVTRFKLPVNQTAVAKKSAYKPFPVGTVRGPYTCGKGTDPRGGVQFLVQTMKGWAPFIENAKDVAKCEAKARAFAATLNS